MKYCTDFDHLPDFEGCCESCHEDQDMGYGLLEISNGDEEAVVCCRIAILLEGEGWE